MRHGMPQQLITLDLEGQPFRVDLRRAHDLAIALNFDGAQPRWFGGPQAGSAPLVNASFSGSVATGASCNCSTLKLTPHCDGTHTECAGHLTLERLDARFVVPLELLPALLLSVAPQRADTTAEISSPAPHASDLLITAGALSQAWPGALPFKPRALIVRTLPNTAAKRTRNYAEQPAAFLSLPAATLLVERGIEHLVLDLPSADRTNDAGHLSAHREFFGLAAGSTALSAVRRPQCTITELAFIDDAVADGVYLLSLQIPALGGDALPSRPLLYPLLAP